jgi:WD40 repeat protein
MLAGFSGACLWEVPSGNRLGEPIPSAGAIWALGFFPGGRSLLVTDLHGGYQVWRIPPDKPVESALPVAPQSGICYSFDFNRAGDRLVMGTSAGLAQVWRLSGSESATPALEPDGPGLQHETAVAHAAFSPDDEYLITWTEGHLLRARKARPARPAPRLLQVGKEETLLAVSPDGRALAVACGTTLEVRRSDKANLPGQPLPHGANVGAAWFSPDGAVLVTGDSAGRLRRWDRTSGKPLGASADLEMAITSLEGDANGDTLCVNHRALWHAPTGKTASVSLGPLEGGAHPQRPRLGLFPGAGALLAVPKMNAVQVSSAWTGEPVGNPFSRAFKIHTVDLSADGRVLAFGGVSSKAEVHRWTGERWEPTGTPAHHPDQIFSIRLSPDGTRVLTGGVRPDRPKRLWDTATGQAVGPSLENCAVETFSPDGRILAVADGSNRVRFWDTRTGKPLGPAYSFPARIRSLRLTADSSTLVVEDALGRAWLWELSPLPLPGAPEQVGHWARTITGLELDAGGGIGGLDPAAWKKARELAEKAR